MRRHRMSSRRGMANGVCVAYIGSSKNIKRRLGNPNHPYHELRTRFAGKMLVYVKVLECDSYKAKEVQLIRLFRPSMNIQHNGEALY